MHIFRDLAAWQAFRRQVTGGLGLVPTMGFLHAGHVSLVARARAENDLVVATVYVNPLQFGQGEDFGAYPRDEARDLELLAQAGAQAVLLPTVAAMVPEGFQTQVTVGALAQPLEGAARPGHFAGVATVVTKLFCLTQPRRAYFGQKDAQQVAVIQRLVKDLGFDVEVVVCPTVREADGLALSSRNVYLSPQERQAAPVLYRALLAAQAAWAAGERQGERLRHLMRQTLNQEPLAQTEYVSAAHPHTLQEAELATGPLLLSLAVRLGRARLIDNLLLSEAVL